MKPELLKATELVKGGATYGEAAIRLGLTRNQVAGACHRLEIKAPLTPEKLDRCAARTSASIRARWSNPKERRRLLQALNAEDVCKRRSDGIRKSWTPDRREAHGELMRRRHQNRDATGQFA